jgi:cardiolipin synthase A/B
MLIAVNIVMILCVVLFSGCQTTLPNVSRIQEESAATQAQPVIVGPKGELRPSKSRELLEKLRQKAGATDLIQANISLMESLGGPPLTAGNHVTLLVDGPATFASMSKAISEAKDHVNIETFIFDDDEVGRQFADLFIRKQSENVQVNLIYDSVGCMKTPSAFFKRLKDAGVNVLEFNPVNPLKMRKEQLLTNRDHRKVVVVDGKVAFTGGVNLSSVYSRGQSLSGSSEGEAGEGWRDTHARIAGPSVAQFQTLFIRTWRDQKGPELASRDYFPAQKPEGDAYVEVIGSTSGDQNRLTFVMYISAIKHAAYFVHLTTPYFVPDRQLRDALAEAAGRGVDVKLILPGASDSKLAYYAGRSHYEDLLEAGVTLYERRARMLHAKTGVIDGVWSTVGSTNLDSLSFQENNEINAIILNTDFAGQMDGLFSRDIDASDEITRHAWSQRPLWDRVKEQFSRLFSEFL